MDYQKGMDLWSWANAHAGLDVIIRCAIDDQEAGVDGEVVAGWMAFDRLDEQTGRMVGMVDGLLYVDRPTSPSSMPVSRVMEDIRQWIEQTGEPPWCMVAVGDGGSAGVSSVDPALIMSIALDEQGIERQRANEQQIEYDRELALLKKLGASEPCCLCGRMLQAEETYDILGPDTGQGDEGEPGYIPIGSTYRVVCHNHL